MASSRADATTGFTPGSRDPLFGHQGRVVRGAGLGIDGGEEVVSLPDGGVVVASRTIPYGKMPTAALTKLDASGHFDPLFGHDGRLVLPAEVSNESYLVGLLRRADGRLVVVMTYGSVEAVIYQRLATGLADPTFGDNGRVVVKRQANRMYPVGAALAPNGDIVIASHCALARVSLLGTPRVVFGTDGESRTCVDGDFMAHGAPIFDVLGRIIVPGESRNYAAIARFSAFGTRDTTFGASGIAATAVPGMFNAAALGPDGIVAVGLDAPSTFDIYQDTSIPLLTEFDTTGTPVEQFGDGGRVVLEGDDYTDRTPLTAVGVDEDGNVTAVGRDGIPGSSIGFSVRVLRAGAVDANYGTDGFAGVDLEGGLAGAFIRDGVVTGTGIAGSNSVVLRLANDGALETSLAENGLRIFNAAPAILENGTVLAVDSANRILYAGGTYPDAFVARRLPNGMPDRTFGDNSAVTLFERDTDYAPTAIGAPTGIALDSQGRIYVSFRGGNGFHGVWALVRLLPSGAVDTSFGENGFVGKALYEDAVDVLVDAQDRPVVVVNPGVPYGKETVVRRYTTDGELDASFGDNGTAVGASDVKPFAAALRPDGGVVVVGDGPAGNMTGLQSFDGDGTPTTGFVAQPPTEADGSPAFLRVTGVHVDTAGRITVAAISVHDATDYYGSDASLIRFLPNGGIDPEFGGGHVVRTGLGTYNRLRLFGPLLQDDGRAVIVGQTDNNGFNRIVRRMPDGTPDPSFGTDGVKRTSYKLRGGGNWENQDGLWGATLQGGQLLVAGLDTAPATSFERYLLEPPTLKATACALVRDLAAGDLDGDGVDEVVVGALAGQSPRVEIYSGGTHIGGFLAYAESYRGGVNVTVGDLDGDGRAEIVTGPASGAAGLVREFTGTGTFLRQFLAYDAKAKHGVDVAISTVVDDARTPARIITGPGPGGPPLVKTFDPLGNQDGPSFYAFPKAFSRGIRVSALPQEAELSDGYVVGSGPGALPVARVFDAKGAPFGPAITVFNTDFRGGVDVGTTRLPDGTSGILVGAGRGLAQVRTIDANGNDVAPPFEAGNPNSTAGAHVAGCIVPV